MPNGYALGADVAVPALQYGSGLIGGGVQRVAWEVSQPLGFMTTGAMALGGTLMSIFMGEGLGGAVANGMAISGYSIMGWVITEKFLLPRTAGQAAVGGRAPASGALQQGAQGAQRALAGALSASQRAEASYPGPPQQAEFQGVRLS